jgi:ribosomal protein S18 acetylase RimI-like enzyme
MCDAFSVCCESLEFIRTLSGKCEMTHAQAIEIRRATPQDSRAIAQVHIASWQAAYAGLMSEQILNELSIEKRSLAWRDMLESNRLDAALACTAGGVVGLTGYSACRDADKDETWGEIQSIYLHPSQFRQGIGSLLLEHACSRLSERGYAQVSLWVLAGTLPARAFYEGAGFVADGLVNSIERGGMSLDEMRYCRALAKRSADLQYAPSQQHGHHA